MAEVETSWVGSNWVMAGWRVAAEIEVGEMYAVWLVARARRARWSSEGSGKKPGSGCVL